MTSRTAGAGAIFALAVAWGFISILVREIPLPALTLVFWRVALGALALAALALVLGRREWLKPPPPAVLATGVLLAVHWAAYFASIRETSVASANLITYANPILMALIAPVLIDERLPRSSVAALLASVVGILVIGLFGPTEGSGAVRTAGVVLAIVAAVTYAVMIVGMKAIGGELHAARLALWQLIVASIALSPAAFAGSYSDLAAREVGYLLLLGVVLTGLTGSIYLAALKAVPATSAGILAYTEPVSAALLAVVLLGEDVTWAVGVGGAMIVAAGIAVIVATRGEPAPAALPP